MINKDKNVTLQITMDKKLAEALDTFIDSMNSNLNAQLSRSKILSAGLILYLDYMKGQLDIKIKETIKPVKEDN